MVKIRIIVEISYDTEDHYNIVFWRPTLELLLHYNYNICLGLIRDVLLKSYHQNKKSKNQKIAEFLQ